MATTRKDIRQKAGMALKGIAALLLSIGIFYAVLVILTFLVKLCQG